MLSNVCEDRLAGVYRDDSPQFGGNSMNDEQFEGESASKNTDEWEIKQDVIVTGSILGANLGTSGTGMGFGAPLAAAGTGRVQAIEENNADTNAAPDSSEADSAGVSEAQREAEAGEMNG